MPSKHQPSTCKASGVITLTTDFGLKDPFVGIMKGRILERFPAARIVDLTHGVEPYWPLEAGLWLARSFRYFPQGSVHLAVVDPGVGSDRSSIVVESEGHLFLAPDNGLLGPMLAETAPSVPKVYRLDLEQAARFGVALLSATFHGRDLYAPLAAALAANRCVPADLGSETKEYIQLGANAPSLEAGTIEGIVVSVDHFGNLITNIPAALVGKFSTPIVRIGAQVLPLNRTYSDVSSGRFVALVNSFDLLEIAQSRGNASIALGIGRGTQVVVCENRSLSP